MNSRIRNKILILFSSLFSRKKQKWVEPMKAQAMNGEENKKLYELA